MTRRLLPVSMRKLLLWFCLLLPFASQAQIPTDFKLEKIRGTPLHSPLDLVVDRQSYIHVLDDGFVTKLDSQGVFVRRVPLTNPANSNSQGYAFSMDAAGNYYVVDFGGGEVRKYNPEGQVLLTFGKTGLLPGQLYQPTSLRVNDAGSIYVIEQSSSRLQKFDAQGKLEWVFDTAPNPTNTILRADGLGLDQAGNAYVLESDFAVIKISPTGQFIQRLELANAPPRGLSVGSFSLTLDEAGNLYVGMSQAYGIRKYTASGQLLTTMRVPQYGAHTAVAFNTAGNVYATSLDHDGVDSKLYKFTSTGQPLGTWGNLTSYNYLVQDGADNFYVYDILTQKIVKFDATGKEVRRFAPKQGASSQVYVVALACDIQNNLYALAVNNTEAHIEKFSPQGQSVSIIENAIVAQAGSAQVNLAVDPAGSIYFIDAGADLVHKFDQQGRQLLQFGARGQGKGQFDQALGLAVDGRGYVYVADINGHRVQKFSPTGQFLRENKALTVQDTYVGRCYASLSVDRTGSVYLGSSMDDFVRVYDPSGKFNRQLPGNSSRLAINSSGTRLLTLRGQQSSNPSAYRPYSDDISFYTATTPPLAVIRESQITGRIFLDQAATCNVLTAPALSNIVVVAEPGNYYGLSDENGNYAIAVDTGTYTIRQLLPQEPGHLIRQTCMSAQIVHVAAYGISFTGPSFGNQEALHPYLSVSVASTRRRRCFRNVTTVAYANTGIAPATNACVLVALPEHVLFVTANAPHIRDTKGNYLFNVGTLAPYQHGTITIYDSVACGDPSIRGLTVCTKAWITPANTYPVPASWNQASIAVRGTSTTSNQARFTVTNTGTGATTDSLSLRVYQDTKLALVHHFSLAAADSLVLRVPATGQLVHVEADQPLGHPLKTTASASVELANRISGGLPSVARPAFPPDDIEPEQAIDCQPILDSYDPNDKQVLPTGLTAAHYTPTDTPLRYQIRFQNTGNDVAYRVEVVDTLAAELDLSTLRVGAVSHPYRLTVTGKTRPILTFTFNTILLPASSQDQVGSNGFLQFSIQPKAGLAPKTSIVNYADIFFDFNEPVRTNTTLNRIFDVPLVVDPTQQLSAKDIIVSPSLSSFSPAQGRAGTLVTLTGQHFAPTLSSNQVLFAGVAAPVLDGTATTLTVRVPTGATTTAIQLLTPDGSTQSATSFTVFQVPTLTGISAEEGVPGALITLAGNHFSPLAAQDTVTFNGVAARVLQASVNSLQVEVPTGATRGLIQVRTQGGQVQSLRPFIVWYSPTLAAFNPGKGKAGTEVVLTGSNFADEAARNLVKLGALPIDVLEASATRLRVRLPALAQSGTWQVQTPGGTATTPAPFVFIAAPVVTSFTPAQGHAGTIVTLTGHNFLAEGTVDTVYFQGLPAVVVSASSTQLVVEAPKSVTTGLIAVAGAGGRSQSAAAFTVPTIAPAEAVTVYPNPAVAFFTINWQPADFAIEHVQVINALGSVVFEQDLRPISTDAVSINLALARAGLYLVVLQTAKGSITKRVTLH
jgi:sugar lactone lactonase YvrE